MKKEDKDRMRLEVRHGALAHARKVDLAGTIAKTLANAIEVAIVDGVTETLVDMMEKDIDSGGDK